MSDDINKGPDDFREVTETGEVSPSSSDSKKTEKICMLCRRPESQTGPMIDLSPEVHVCQECMQKSLNTVQNGQIDFSSFLQNIPHMTLDLTDLSGLSGLNGLFRGAQPDEKEEDAFDEGFSLRDVPPPHRIKEKLDQYVIGQEHAKKVVAVAVYNHYKRVLEADRRRKESKGAGAEGKPARLSDREAVRIEKSNILLIGPTGSGKTYLVQTLAELLDIPLALTDATSLTEAGYIGDDIESVVSKLLMAAGNKVGKAERGIIFVDEIDKLAKKKNANQRDVSGEAVQQGMLKLLEGSEIEVPVGASSKNAMVPLKTVDTRNILFICGGAFPGLEDIIKERLNKTGSIGFHADLRDKYDDDPNLLQKVTVEDLRNFGMIPEFLGRLPIICTLESLTEEMLVKVLKEPKNAILKQYQELLALDEVKLSFDDDALHAIAREAVKRKTGARALRAIIEDFMLDIMYEIPKDDNIGEVVITGPYIEHTGGPRIILRGQSA